MNDVAHTRLAIPNGWGIALCEPESPAGTGCQPTVLAARYSRTRDSRYRGACFGCGWIGGDRDDSNVAVEDAHDHTHPGWRELPIVDRPRRTGDPKKDDAKVRALGVQVARVYPPEWPQRCGPIRTWRDSSFATRHVPGYSPWGGFDMAVLREAAEPEPILEQLRLQV